MVNGDLLRHAIVRATKELWQADFAEDSRMSQAWFDELTYLLEEYRRPLDTAKQQG
jgi:hypothetical protein